VPAWSKDPKAGPRLINARSETLATKPAFRTAFRQRRCLIPADGFYEWQKVLGAKVKQPFYIRLVKDRPFAFAGLWDRWHNDDGSTLESCTIVTTEPNDVLRALHDRMPVILPNEAYGSWLDPKNDDIEQLHECLRPYPAEEMMAYPISTLGQQPSERPARVHREACGRESFTIDSQELTTQQAATMRHRLAPHLRYLRRIKRRTDRRGFPAHGRVAACDGRGLRYRPRPFDQAPII
jgi:putative SOS response-associated peptidase YedK